MDVSAHILCDCRKRTDGEWRPFLPSDASEVHGPSACSATSVRSDGALYAAHGIPFEPFMRRDTSICPLGILILWRRCQPPRTSGSADQLTCPLTQGWFRAHHSGTNDMLSPRASNSSGFRVRFVRRMNWRTTELDRRSWFAVYRRNPDHNPTAVRPAARK